MLKKVLPIFLLLAFLFNMGGIFVVFKIEQFKIRRAIKQEIKAGLDEDELHYFTFSAVEYAQLDWERENKEFRLGREMFDIIRMKNAGDTMELYCVNDTEEALLFAGLDELAKEKSEKESGNPNHSSGKVLKMLKKFQYTNEPVSLFEGGLTTSKYGTGLREGPYSSPYIDRETPPPDSV